MASGDEGPLRGIQMRDHALGHLESHSGASDEWTEDIDARKIALLGQKQRLQV